MNRLTWKVLIKCKTGFKFKNQIKSNSYYMLRGNSKSSTLELAINRDSPYERGIDKKKNPANTLPKRRVISKSKSMES
jgi:hypothetical protein